MMSIVYCPVVWFEIKGLGLENTCLLSILDMWDTLTNRQIQNQSQYEMLGWSTLKYHYKFWITYKTVNEK